MYHIGTDIIEIARIQEAINHWGEASLTEYILTPRSGSAERVCHPWRHALPVRKQSSKPWEQKKQGVSWREIEILSQPSGKPLVRLYGRAQAEAASLDINEFTISLSHSKEYAIAFVVGATK